MIITEHSWSPGIYNLGFQQFDQFSESVDENIYSGLKKGEWSTFISLIHLQPKLNCGNCIHILILVVRESLPKLQKYPLLQHLEPSFWTKSFQERNWQVIFFFLFDFSDKKNKALWIQYFKALTPIFALF